MTSPYTDRFWRKNWDEGLTDLDPSLWETSYTSAVRNIFDNFADVMALSFQGLEITFGQIDKSSNQFAHMLSDQGFKKGDVVGINLPNTPEYVIAFLGTLKAGCVVSGVSPLMSDVQMHYQIKDLGAGEKNVALVTLDAIFEHRLKNIISKLPQLKLVITTSVIGSFPKEQQAKIRAVKEIPFGKVTPLEGKIVLDFHDDILAKYPTELPTVDVTPDDIAFIQYTGGTTGPPKGAMLTHRNAVSDLMIVQTWLDWEKGAKIALSGFPFFHIAGLFFCYACIYLGWGQVLIADPRDTLTICNELKKYKPTALVNVPSLFQILINTKKFKRLDHSNLDVCISAAAPFPVESQQKLESIVGAGKLLEAYGMTECSPLSTMNPYRGKRKLGSIGLPLLNVELKLIDPESGEEVPLGEAGEICVRGPMVMKGYYNKPEETKKAIDSDGFMHTGDVAIMSEDGYLRIVDRTKDMIIVGGFKVFSSKVEDTLIKHPAIGMVALIGIPNPDRPGSEIVKAILQLNCAPYEVPKIIEIAEELPLTVVGKIDKKSLRK